MNDHDDDGLDERPGGYGILTAILIGAAVWLLTLCIALALPPVEPAGEPIDFPRRGTPSPQYSDK